MSELELSTTCKKGKFRATEEVSVGDESESSVREL